MLRGKKPAEVKKRLKAFVYGAPGTGKTMFCLQWPAPYVIDCERGAENTQYIKALEESGGVLFQTTDFNDIVSEVRALLSEKHSYKTLIIDPLTIIYSNLVESCVEKLKRNGKDGTELGRHYAEANKQIRRLLSLILKLDMNVIITSHAKEKYGHNMAIIGQTYDCYKKIDYLFDIAIEVNKIGKDRKGIIQKTRISEFKEDEVINFSYKDFADRYGRDIIEKEVSPVTLASSEKIDELNSLIRVLKLSDDSVRKWLERAAVEAIEDMPQDCVIACIEYCKKRLEVNEKRG